MAQAARTVFMLNLAHTGGKEVFSDIVMPEEMVLGAWPVANDDFFDDDDEGFMEVEDGVGPLLVWRGLRRR